MLSRPIGLRMSVPNNPAAAARCSRARVGAGTHHALLLHRLREVLRPAPQRLERAALRVDGAVGVALADLALGLAHGFARRAELIHLALPLLPLAEALLAQLLHQLVEPIAQRLLVLAQLAHLV